MFAIGAKEIGRLAGELKMWLALRSEAVERHNKAAFCVAIF
jgi:hypothetical protein